MVVADDEDDVVPAKLPHHVEPHVGLVGVRGHRPKEGQMDALESGRKEVSSGDTRQESTEGRI